MPAAEQSSGSSATPDRVEDPVPHNQLESAGVNWRFLVPDGEEISFTDLHLGPQRMIAGQEFGDFIVWRRDDIPAYQLAVVVDDAAMRITEVVRGADLLKSTARQILLFRALGLPAPNYYHCDLIRDEAGVRLAKRHDALSIRKLRELGWTPEQVRSAAICRLSSAATFPELCGDSRLRLSRERSQRASEPSRPISAPTSTVYNL